MIASTSNSVHINFNGRIIPSGQPVLTADNRGFRYGDGIFETMAVKDGRIRLGRYHFERLMSGAALLQFTTTPLFTPEILTTEVLELCRMNGHSASGRVRLVVFRGDGGFADADAGLFPNYIIQSWPLAPENDAFNEKAWSIDLFPEGRKSCDPFSNLKSNNYLLYTLAALYAQKNGLDDSLVLNSQGRIADSSIANLFYLKGNCIYTPALSEGCVAGVMRRYLVESLPAAGFAVREKETTIEDLESAEEVFLTNALKGIRWVGRWGHVTWGSVLTRKVYKKVKEGGEF